MWKNHYLRILVCLVVVLAVDSDSTDSTETASTVHSSTALPSSHAESIGLSVMPSSVHPAQSSSGSMVTMGWHTDQSSTADPYTSIFPTSTMVPATTATPSTHLTLIYQYSVRTNDSLAIGIVNLTNPDGLNSIHQLVRQSFNLSNFMLTVTKAEIKPPTKILTSHLYNLLIDILFQSNHSSCNAICIDHSKSTVTPSMNLTLPNENGTWIPVELRSGPVSVNEAPPIDYRQGESSPGLAARLGMGIGIPLLGLLLIAEIVFLGSKYGLSRSARRHTYDIPMSQRL